MRVKGTLSSFTSCGGENDEYKIAKIYDYETLSDLETQGKKPHATGNTLTETSMRCPPEPTITPSTGATSV